MQTKFLKEVVIIVVGKHAEKIVDLMSGTKNVNEFLIAKKLDLTINQTRNILYKLSDHGLVSSIRKKDKKKGWYTYFWKIEIVKSLEFLKIQLEKQLVQLENQIKSRETKMFYACERCNREFTEENALINEFMCNECGDVFKVKDNSKFLKELKRARDKFQEQLKLVQEEIDKENEKEEKKRQKELKKIADEKAKARKKTAKKKSVKKPKKKVKKKVIKKKKPVKKKSKKPIKKLKKKVVKKKIKKKLVKKVKKKPVKKKVTKKKMKKAKKPKKKIKKKKK